MPKYHRLARVVILVGLVLAGCRQSTAPLSENATAKTETVQEAVPPALGEHRFVPRSDNPYFPLVPGTKLHYRSRTDEGTETEDFIVTHKTKVIQGVKTRVIEDIVRLDGAVTEHTFDWFAQDEDGNVWYFGEDSRTFDPVTGRLISREGSWKAGEDGAEAGIIMKAHPKVGETYNEENAPGVAEDKARVLSLDAVAKVPAGTFRRCLQTENFTPLDPEFREHKFYARGVGLVLEVLVSGGEEQNKLVRITRPDDVDDDDDGDHDD